MEFFIKKIFDNKTLGDDWVHVQFQKFSRGKFSNRAMVKVKNSKGNYTIETTSEYAKELVKIMGEKLGYGKTHVTGAMVSALELSGLKYEEKKMAIGVKKYIIDREMNGKEIVEICNSFPKAFFGLSFNVGEEELKIQAKSPKSAKGAGSSKKEDADLKIDFCKLKTSDKSILEGLVFDKEAKDLNFKKIEIKHNFIIDEIVIPPELKNEKDFAIVREKALRKGKIIRVLNIDGREERKEIGFEA